MLILYYFFIHILCYILYCTYCFKVHLWSFQHECFCFYWSFCLLMTHHTFFFPHNSGWTQALCEKELEIIKYIIFVYASACLFFVQTGTMKKRLLSQSSLLCLVWFLFDLFYGWSWSSLCSYIKFKFASNLINLRMEFQPSP